MMTKNKIRFIYLLLIGSFIFLSCSQYKYIYNDIPLNKDKLDEMFLQLKSEDEILLIFTTKFNDKIKVREGDKILLDTIITSDSKTNIAKVLKSKKNLNTYIEFNNRIDTIYLDKNKKYLYNIIYFQNSRNKTLIEFSNHIKKLNGNILD